MKQRLVRVVTEDKIYLEGLLSTNNNSTTKVVLHIHGMAGNFYDNLFLDKMAESYTDNEWTFLTVNSRGHDHIAETTTNISPGYTKIGNFNEIFEDCLLDIFVWLEFLKELGYKEIILQGHSLGCNKVTYYQSLKQETLVKGLILIAPPDMVGLSELWSKYQQTLDLAKNWVQAGKGDEILPDYLDDWYGLTAKTYLNFSQRGDAIDIFDFKNNKFSPILSVTKIPTFVVIGTKDNCTIINPELAMQQLQKGWPKSSKLTTKIIPQANHVFFGT